jgi:flagellar motor switch protein FliN
VSLRPLSDLPCERTLFKQLVAEGLGDTASYFPMPGIDANYPMPMGSPPGAPVRSSASEDQELAARLAHLPAYTRSLLRIKLPVVVTLATIQQPVSRVLELAPGTILHFAKSCDDPLTLCVGNREVAVGETVKVGEKFGLRITSMVMPEEKFEPLKPPTRP